MKRCINIYECETTADLEGKKGKTSSFNVLIFFILTTGLTVEY